MNFPLLKKNKKLHYLDSAATTHKPKEVVDRIKKFYTHENANVHRGIYDLSEHATQMYEEARKSIANFVHAKSEREIIFTSGTTDSINLVGYSWIWKNVFEGDTLLTSQMEHHSNFIPWQQAAKRKEHVSFEVVKLTDNYQLDLDDLEAKFKAHQPKLFAITHISNTLGTVNPIKEIVAIKERVSPHTRILIDGAQAVSHIPVDVQDLGVDFYAFSGHKMYGPTGIGVLWAREEILTDTMSPYRYGGGMIRSVNISDSTWADLPEKFEGGTPNIAGAIGLNSAVEFIEKIGFSQIQSHEHTLIDYFFKKLDSYEHISLHGLKASKERIGVFSLTIPGVHPHDIAQILSNNNVAVRAGHHCTQILMRDVLNVVATIRVSFGIYTKKNDIDAFFKGIEDVFRLFPPS